MFIRVKLRQGGIQLLCFKANGIVRFLSNDVCSESMKKPVAISSKSKITSGCNFGL